MSPPFGLRQLIQKRTKVKSHSLIFKFAKLSIKVSRESYGFKVLLVFLLASLSFVSLPLSAQIGLPAISVNETSGGTEYSLTLQILILMTVLTLLPSLLIMMTSFVRIIIVMSLLRQAIGTAQTPPNTVLIGISLFLTFFIMAPIFSQIYNDAITPSLESQLNAEQAVAVAEQPLR